MAAHVLGRAALLSALVLGPALQVEARQLTTLDGGLVTLEAVVAPVELADLRSVQPSVVRTVLAWTVRDAVGTVQEGLLAGAGGIRDELPLLVQNPIDGEIHMIFAAEIQGSRDLFLRSWLGQSWSEPTWLAGSPDRDDHRPRAAFTPRGEILLAWAQAQPSGDHVLFQYGEIDASGMQFLLAHLDIGRPRLYMHSVDGDVRLEEGVAELRTDATGEQALLFLADPAADEVGVVRLDLRALRRIIGGGSFAPVPVNFLQVARGNGGGAGSGGLGGNVVEAGEVLPAWRVELLDGEGYYWFDEATMSGLGFRDGRVRGGLITIASPSDEVVAHARMVARLRHAIGRIEADLAPILVREGASRDRRSP